VWCLRFASSHRPMSSAPAPAPQDGILTTETIDALWSSFLQTCLGCLFWGESYICVLGVPLIRSLVGIFTATTIVALYLLGFVLFEEVDGNPFDTHLICRREGLSGRSNPRRWLFALVLFMYCNTTAASIIHVEFYLLQTPILGASYPPDLPYRLLKLNIAWGWLDRINVGLGFSRLYPTNDSICLVFR